VFLAIGLVAAIPSRTWADSESWDAVYIGGTKVGYIWTRVEPVKDGEKQLTRVRVNIVFEFKRGRDTSRIDMEYGTIETPEGQILRLDTRLHASANTIRVHGDVINEKMKLKIENGDQKQEEILEWSPDTFGPYGVEMSLSRHPMKAGETRKVKAFIPNLNKIGLLTLTARGPEQVPLGGKVVRELLRVDQEVTFLDGKKFPEMNTTFWVDSGGQVLRSFTDSDGGMTIYRTTREAAQKGLGQFDLIAASVVKIGRKISNPEATRGVTYKVTMPDVNPAELFPTDARQSIKSTGAPNSAILEVSTASPFVGQPGPEAVAPEYLATNTYITCTDRVVADHAREAVGREIDPWKKAEAINKWVAKHMRNKNFETG
jgi:hypothetical protein